jgi:hypothetical protein
LKQWIEQIKGDTNGDVDWSLLRPPATEQIIALRLLCESWLMVHWDEASTSSKRAELAKALEVAPESYKLPEGIQLNTPHSRGEWIAPFCKSHEDDPIESITKELVLEDNKVAVRDFLTSMETAQPDFPCVADLFLRLDGVVRSST